MFATIADTSIVASARTLSLLPPSSREMNVANAIRDYVIKMVDSVPGMKVLMMDHDTASIVGMVVSKSSISQKEVYLFELIEKENRDTLPHLKAVCFLRPTAFNIRLLSDELFSAPKYGQYHIFFTNFLPEADLETLAKADAGCAVEQVQEFFADYFAVNNDTFSFNCPNFIYNNKVPSLLELLCLCQLVAEELFNITERCCSGLSAVILSLRKKPFIRYQRSSELCSAIAMELNKKMTDQTLKSLYDTQRPDQPTLLIIDRRNDPVTPLLHQWTYQAMVHELLTIRNNVCFLPSMPFDDSDRSSKDFIRESRELVLAPEFDSFYESQMYNNFGELGDAVTKLRDEYLKRREAIAEIKETQSLEKLKDFIESDLTDHKKLQANVNKHVNLCDELTKLVTSRKLMDVSELEQGLAIKNEPVLHLQRLLAIIDDPTHDNHDKTKLAMLYQLRYESSKDNQTPIITGKLLNAGVPSEMVQLLGHIIKYAGQDKRLGDVFANRNIWALGKSFVKSWQGVEHNLLAHKPLLNEFLDEIVQGKLNLQDFPHMGNQPREQKVTDMIIFIAGGVTYEEARCVHEVNASKHGVKIILGGSSVLNSTSFMEELAKQRQ